MKMKVNHKNSVDLKFSSCANISRDIGKEKKKKNNLKIKN